MKMFRKLVLTGLAAGGLILAVPQRVSAQDVSVGVSISATADFYEPLTPYGTWVEVGSYGRCWRPAHVEVGWRPYCEGTWVWTDCGWYWQTEEPWGWACYHYGSWMLDPGFGWVWLPATEWAPAWVEWRLGGGYIGWAPVAPRGVVVAAPMFAFVAVGRFHEPIRRSAVVVNNTTIINQTTVVNNNIRRETRNVGGKSQQVVINNGPGVAPVEQATGRKIDATPIQVAANRTPKPSNLKPAGNTGTAKPAQPNQPRRGQPLPVQPTQPERGRGRGDGRDGGMDQPDRPHDGQPNEPDHGGGKGRGRGDGGMLIP